MVLSASSFTHPCTALSRNAQKQTPQSTTPIQDSNPVFQTSKTQQNLSSLCQLTTPGGAKMVVFRKQGMKQ
eukprot:5210379-Ditylum_brightwellii.AAC.1